jgi:hypothetical protein
VDLEQRFEAQAKGMVPDTGLVQVGTALFHGQLQRGIENGHLAVGGIIHRRLHILPFNAQKGAKRIEAYLRADDSRALHGLRHARIASKLPRVSRRNQPFVMQKLC